MGVKRDGQYTDTCLDKLKEGEPFFVLRAQDKLAAGLVEIWANLAAMPEGDALSRLDDLRAESRRPYHEHSAKTADALILSEDMAHWPDQKMPD